MKSMLRYRSALAATVLISALLAASVASPAFGGPSVGQLAKVAAKALKVGKKAKKKSRVAQRTANAAQATADSALDQSGPPGIVSLSQEGTAPPSDFVEFDVQCPAGTRAVGIGQGLGALEPVFFASYGGGALGAMFNPSETTSFSGNFYVECVEGFAATVARRSTGKSEALDELRERKQEVLEAAK